MVRRRWCLGTAAPLALLMAAAAAGQQAQLAAGQQAQVAAGQPAQVNAPTHALTLDEALALATKNEPVLAAATAEQKALALDRTNARVALLPTATYHNQAIYTQRNGVPSSRIGQTTDAPAPIFIANNAVREYASQGVFDERIGLGQFVAIKLADANAARAQAELEVTRRGLVATVVALYYGADAAREKLDVAQRALDEASKFVDTTQKREAAREAAHADVLKAQLTQQQRERDVADAQLAAAKNRMELAVLLFPDPGTPYTLASTNSMPMLPQMEVVQALAGTNNPEIRSALASVQVSQFETASARSALYPELALNFTYGIDATNFAVNGPDGIRNLGYSMSAQLDIPVWNWLSTQRAVKAARYRENAAKTALTAVQRRAIANLNEFYAEADVAGKQLASLERSVDTARESLRLTNLRYVDGESTVLEVVDAQNALTAAESAVADGKLRYRVSLASLQTLTGKLP